MTQKIQKIEKEIIPIIDQAKNIKINSKEDMLVSVEMLSRCNKYLDALKTDKEKITKPLNEALKEVREKYKPSENVLEEAIGYLRGEQSRYQTEQVILQREEEAKIAARMKPGKGNLSVEKAVEKLENIERADTKIETESGTVKFRETQVLKIWDVLLVPREYMLPDEKLILADLKAGKSINGARLEITQIPINSR